MTDRAATQTIDRYYDFLYLWAQWTNRFKAFRKPGSHPIHRVLADPVTGDIHTDVVHDLIARELDGIAQPTGLDAGCGYGGTRIVFHKWTGGHRHGSTVNQRQVEVARRNFTALGLESSLTIERRSYDEALTPRFDVVVAIESLIHSRDPARTIASLGHALKPGGTFVIVDDMPDEPFPAAFADDLAGFKAGWKCPVAPNATQWIALLEQAGCQIAANHDLTALTQPRPDAELATLLADVRRRRRWRDRLGLGLVSDALEGGFHLERLLAARAVRYRLLVARKG
jgi:SAM-dependent methyltransferase